MKLVFLGDSTLQYNDESTYPQVGWPQALEGKLNKDVEVFNFAKNGRSTKSFIEEGLFENALKVIDKDSAVIIEFGHNDSHDYDLYQFTRPDIEYRNNLIYMVNECKKRSAYVLLITPVYRRWFNDDGTIRDDCHTGYREAMLKVAKDTDTDVIDMTLLTKNKLQEIGYKDSRKLFMNFDAGEYENYPEGKDDNTHLTMKGATMIAKLFIEQIHDNKHLKGIINDQYS